MAFQKDKTNSRARRLYFGLDRAAARANTCCTAPRSGSERCLGDLGQLAQTTLACPSARGRSWVTAKANSPSFFEHTILGCPKGGAITLLVAVPPSHRALAMNEEPTIIIVDDDPGIREALSSLIRSVGVQAKALASVPEFLNEGRPDGPTCLVLDVRLA